MNEVFSPLLAHKFEHFEKLFEMQILLVGDDIQAFIKIVGILAVDCRGQIAGGVE